MARCRGCREGQSLIFFVVAVAVVAAAVAAAVVAAVAAPAAGVRLYCEDCSVVHLLPHETAEAYMSWQCLGVFFSNVRYLPR